MMSQGEKKIFIVFLIATLQVIILQAARAGETANTTTATTAATSQGPSGAQSLTNESTANKPAGSKPTGANLVNGATKPSSGNQPFGSCWTCLLQAVEEICSYLTDWTSPKKIPNLNLFSLFHQTSSEESEDSVEMPGIASLFRFKRSVEDPVMAQKAFLDLLDGFYVKARERFASENPGLLFAGSDNPYNSPDEIAQVVAYVLGVPKDKLVQVFKKMETRRTGEILLRALADRRSSLSGEEQHEYKSMSGLNPTSIAYFFKELFGSANGVATGFSEIVSIILQNQNTNVKPNKVK